MIPRSTNRFRSRCWTCSTSSTEPPPAVNKKLTPIARGERRLKFVESAGCDRIAHRLHQRLIEMQRSEEHTSELQSLMRISYAVFCLTKKKLTLRPVIHTRHTAPIATSVMHMSNHP